MQLPTQRVKYITTAEKYLSLMSNALTNSIQSNQPYLKRRAYTIINQSGKSECHRLWEAATATAATHKYPAKVHC